MITSFTAARIAGDAWRLRWASDLPSPTFRLYRDGLLELTTAAAEAIVAVAAGASSVFELLDDDTPNAPAAYPDHVTLAWYATAATSEYRVEQQTGEDWTPRATVPDDGRGYFTWASGRLADGQTHAFRVVPVGANGNAGTPTPFTALIVRTPDVPAVTYAYNAADGTLTISES